MAETRRELKERLKAVGLWAQFTRLRDELKAQGHSPASARREALARVESSATHPAMPKAEEPSAAGRAPTSGPEPMPLCERCRTVFAQPTCAECFGANGTLPQLWHADFREEAQWLAQWMETHANDRPPVHAYVSDAELEVSLRLPPTFLVDMTLVLNGAGA